MKAKQHTRNMVQVAGQEYPLVQDLTLLGNWEEIQAATMTRASAITKNDADNEILDGLVLYGYEMKWGETNENGEQYEKGAFDGFINDYFVTRGLNMPVDINHEGYRNWQAYCGRVLYIETNSVGFYFVVYIPRGYAYYEQIKWALQSGIVQGFSKEGYATDWEYKYNADGSFAYELVKEMKLLSVSLVCTPANGVAFERMKEVKNGLTYINKTIEDKDKPQGKTFAEMFNK